MPTYSTWGYYSGSYGGKLSQDVYTRRAVDAKYEIDRLTNGKAEIAPESMGDRLARCECRMGDAMESFNSAKESLGIVPGVSSVSNDGFSVSVRENSLETYSAELESIARQLLTFPVNLLFCGAVVRSAHV